MRPQFAMAAVLVLVVGSSLLFLRARPGTMGSPVSVTERGNPLPESKADSHEAPAQAARGRSLGEGALDGRPGAAAPLAADNAEPAAAPKGGGAATSDALTEAHPPPARPDEQAAGAADLDRADALKKSVGCDAARDAYERIVKQRRGTKEAERAAAELRACATSAPSASATAPPD